MDLVIIGFLLTFPSACALIPGASWHPIVQSPYFNVLIYFCSCERFVCWFNALNPANFYGALRPALRPVLTSVTISSLVIADSPHGYSQESKLPRSVLALDWVLILGLSLSINLLPFFLRAQKHVRMSVACRILILPTIKNLLRISSFSQPYTGQVDASLVILLTLHGSTCRAAHYPIP